MKKILYLFLIVIAVVITTKAAYACVSKDAKFRLGIINIEIDSSKLDTLCVSEGCVNEDKSITMKSRYDDRVELIITKYADKDGFDKLEVKLPFNLDKMKNPAISTIDPEEYNWEESLKTDLIFLKNSAVLNISEEDIQKISGLAGSGGAIIYCNGKWQSTESVDCFCFKDKEISCPDCL